MSEYVAFRIWLVRRIPSKWKLEENQQINSEHWTTTYDAELQTVGGICHMGSI